MLKWPCNKTSATDVYDLNEKRIGSGYYPVGINNMWHSGIHIPSYGKRAIYPLLNGKLVAYRVSTDYIKVEKKEKIIEEMWKSLSDADKKCYTIKLSLWGSHTYELKPECKTAKDLYSDNFVLMSHELLVNASEKDTIKFYTLYMNLAPDNSMNLASDSTRKDHYNGYVEIDSYGFKIPFYREWVFKVKNCTIQEYKYVNGATLGGESGELNPGDEFTMCNGDGDFFLNSKEDKTAIVIKKHPRGTTESVVMMSDIKGKLQVKSVHKIGNIMKAHKELTTEQCIGFPAKKVVSQTSIHDGMYDLVLILEKDLLGTKAEKLIFNFFNDKLYSDTTGSDPIEPTDDLLSAVESGIISNIIETDSSDEYVKLSGYDYYYKRDKTSAFNWGNFFNKVPEDCSKKSGDILCDKCKVLKSATPEECKGLFIDCEYKISKEEVQRYFGFTTLETENDDATKLRSKLRRLIAHHPLEWNSALYDNIVSDGEKYGITIPVYQEEPLKNVAKATDIWSGASGLGAVKGIADTNKCAWFAHPIYFINHFKREGLLDFNPYEGKVLNVRFPDDADLKKYPKSKDDYKKIEVKSCPGFAPVNTVPTDIDARFPAILQDATNPNYYWGALNIAFGKTEYYNAAYGKDHAGIDLGGSDGDPIISMITGKVWATTWKGKVENIWGRDPPAVNYPGDDYGRLMIIKDMNNDLLYLLAHLSAYKKEVGEYVYPGETVALVGDTGGSEGAHLHLEVLVCDATEKSKVLLATNDDGTYNNRTPDKDKATSLTGLTWTGNYSDGDQRWAHRRNPLDHSEIQT